MIIDDDEILATTLSTVLRGAGHDAATCSNGRVGLDRFSASPDFDVVITDLIMPEIEGIGLIRTLRAMAPALQIIAISGGGRTRNFDYLCMALELGANEVIRKPFSAEALISSVNKCLGRREGGAARAPPPMVADNGHG